MGKINLLKLRKATGISQRELAEKLSVRPSFLSAIENGRSRFPDDKIEKLKDILNLKDLSEYITEDDVEVIVPPHTHEHDETDSIALLLKHIHAQAHKDDKQNKSREIELEDKIHSLMDRNNRLSDRVDDLRDEVDRLKSENFHLKELLIKNNIAY